MLNEGAAGIGPLTTERWYDLFSTFYDLSCERLYWSSRLEVARRIGPSPGRVIVDLCCGTGANFPHLAAATAGGRLVGIDGSAGMLSKAARRARRLALGNVSLVQGDVRRIAETGFIAEHGIEQVDGVVCTLGLSVVSGWESVLDAAVALIRPGGCLVIMDGRTLGGRLRWLDGPLRTYLRFLARGDILRPIEDAVVARTSGAPVARFLVGHIFVAGGPVG